MPNGDEDVEDGGDDGDKASKGPRSAHELKMQALKERIKLLKAEQELQELEDERARLERERREAPEERAQQKQELARKRGLEESELARQRALEDSEERRKDKEAYWQDKEASWKNKAAKRDDRRERETLGREARERMAAAVGAQLDKTRVGDLQLRDAPSGFVPKELRDFSERGTSIYDFGDADIGERDDADYFALTEEQAQDLYERIGANRGVVFDPGQDDVFHLSFRPVLRGPVTESALENELRADLGKLTEKLRRLEVEQSLLEREIERSTPPVAAPAKGKSASSAGSTASAIDALLRDAVVRKERLEDTLKDAVSWGPSRYESILQGRLERIAAEDAQIQIKLPSNGSVLTTDSTRSAALEASRRLRESLVVKLVQLEQHVEGMKSPPSRTPLVEYLQGIRAKVCAVEEVERRLGQQAERDALEALRQLIQSKRWALEARLEAAWKKELGATLRAEATGAAQAASVTAKQATDAVRDELTELDRQWVAIEAELRGRTDEPPEGLDKLAELRAAVDSDFAGQIDDQVKSLQEDIRSLSKEWIETLDKHRKKAKPGTNGDEPEIQKALAVFEEQFASLEKDLDDVKGTSGMSAIRALRKDFATLALEWQKTLATGAIDGSSRDPEVAKIEARAAVKREIERLLLLAAEARSAKLTEQEARLSDEIRQAEAWCEHLCAAKRLYAVANERRELKQLEVDEARAKVDAVKKALGKILQAGENGASGAATLPARIYFRKPELDAKFENKFTASELEAKAMSSGIDTTDFRVNSAFASAFVSGGGGWGRSTEDSRMRGDASSSKKIYITSSFSLPKVELSLPLERPCASDEFLAAVQAAVAAPTAPEKADKLFYVLKEFGHFVPRRLTVGGKLYSTEERELTGAESASEEAKKRANEVQASISVSTPWFGGGVESKAGWGSSELEQEARRSLHEAQKLVLNVVGGEGGYAKNLPKWSDSLQSYTRWQVIGMADLCPSVHVLPDEEKRACVAILSEYVRSNHQILTSKKAAQFLFYSGWAEAVGLRPTYFYLRNGQRVLSLPGNENAGMFAVTADPVRITDNGQLWTISADGYVVNQLRRDGVELALTLKDKDAIVAVPPDPANESQIWNIPHRGPITGRAVVNASKQLERAVLKADATGKVTVDVLSTGATLTSYHQWVVVPQEAMLATARKARVVYRSQGHIVELSLDHGGSWGFVPLTAKVTAPKAKGTPFAYTTAFDGVPRVVYVDESGDVQELWLPPERSWLHAPLASITRAPKAAGDVFGYVGDNTARVLYRAVDGYVRELYLVAGEVWHCADLTNSTVKAGGNPLAYVTGTAATNWTPRVVFTDGNGDIWEFRLGGAWQGSNLTKSWQVKPAGNPFAYVTDGTIARVLFRDTQGKLQEIYSQGGETWKPSGSLATDVDGDPIAFIGPDGKPRVLFRDKGKKLQLLSLGQSWTKKDLMAELVAPRLCPGQPIAFVTSDKITRVIYRDNAQLITELSLIPGEAYWRKTDLTTMLKMGDWPPDSDPTGYAT